MIALGWPLIAADCVAAACVLLAPFSVLADESPQSLRIRMSPSMRWRSEVVPGVGESMVSLRSWPDADCLVPTT